MPICRKGGVGFSPHCKHTVYNNIVHTPHTCARGYLVFLSHGIGHYDGKHAVTRPCDTRPFIIDSSCVPKRVSERSAADRLLNIVRDDE